jgi:hypothetical protein
MTAMPPKEEKVDHAFYEELQAQLKEALNAKKAADKSLSGVEDQIEKFEGSPQSRPSYPSELLDRDECKWKRSQRFRELPTRTSTTSSTGRRIRY